MWLFDLFFFNSATLICQGTDIWKYFREFLGLWDKESRLYLSVLKVYNLVKLQIFKPLMSLILKMVKMDYRHKTTGSDRKNDIKRQV